MFTFLEKMSSRQRYVVLLAIIYVGFVSLGLPDTILGVAWASMRTELRQPIYYAGFIATLLTLCSAVSAFFSGAILRRLGTGKLLTLCGFVTGLSLWGYALAPGFWMLLVCAIPLGFGQGAVDTGMNFYVAKNYTSRDMSWLHCCWGVGASSGPVLVTLLLAAGWSWRAGYGVVGSIQLLLALVFLLTLGLWRTPGEGKEDRGGEALAGKVRYDARFWCCPAMFLLYCGIEFSVGLWAFAFLTGCRGFGTELAGFAVAGYWGMLTAGRFLIGFVANRLGNVRLIRYSMLLGMLGGLGMLGADTAWLTLASLGLVGFGFASFYPSMMHAAPERFDDATAATVIGYQGGAGMLGTALIPAGFGYLAARTSFALLPYFVLLITLAIALLQWKLDGRHGRCPAAAVPTESGNAA